ncbi:MAG: hypothetical protein KF863_21400 [Rubrivivax sp.]|nr:hypothetical protein [Rubrivivax sp.]
MQGIVPLVPEAGTIYNALRSWWSMDENAASSIYADSHGPNHLTARTGASTINTSTISSTTAKKGRASNLNRVDDRCAYIPRANTALDMPNADFSFGGWFTLGFSAATAAFLMGRVGDATTTRIQAYLFIENDGNLKAGATTDGTISTRVQTSTGIGSGTWSGSEYQLVVLTFNRTGNQLEIRFRRPGHSSGALLKSTVAFPSALYTGANNSNFAICEGLRADTNFFSSNRSAAFLADECFFVDKALSDAEVNYLYAAGAGRSYSELRTDAGY